MFYKYPIEPKRTTHEITIGNNRYNAVTGEELPPIPYININSANAGGNAASPKKTAVKTAAKTNVNTVSQNSNEAAMQEIYAQKLREQLAALENSYNSRKNLLGQNYDSQRFDAEQSNNSALRDLYIAYMQGIKNIPQQAALQGAGGEIESIKSRHRTNYEDNRAKQNLKYSDVLSEIQQKYNNDLMELEEKYLKQLMSL